MIMEHTMELMTRCWESDAESAADHTWKTHEKMIQGLSLDE